MNYQEQEENHRDGVFLMVGEVVMEEEEKKEEKVF
jgi:hypothetical protein